MNHRVSAAGAAFAVLWGLSACSSSTAPSVVLSGQDLGVVELGAPFEEAVAKLTEVLGAPTAAPTGGRSCPESTREVGWPGLRIGERSGVLVGWVSTSGELATNRGIRVGSTRTELEEAYGDDLALLSATAGVARSFSVRNTALAGNIDPSGTIMALFSGACGA